MAHKKAGGSVRNGRDSAGQRLGVKVGDGQKINAGGIIVRQHGTTFAAGRAGRAGNCIRQHSTHRIIGTARTARADAEELRRLRLCQTRQCQAESSHGCQKMFAFQHGSLPFRIQSIRMLVALATRVNQA